MDSLPLLAWPGAPSERARLAILIYHRVLPVSDPLRPDEPDAQRFDRQMAFLARHFDVLPLCEAAAALAAGRLPKRACCVTFDDGYADNLDVALPILESHRLPATVFVATGYLDGGRMFNDSVIELVNRSAGQGLDLRDLDMGQYAIASVKDRLQAVSALLARLKYLPPSEREARVAGMVEIAGCGPLPTDLMLNTSQLKAMAERGMEIGGHTDTHTILTTLEEPAALAEITRGKARLEEITGRPVRTFAYPNGRPYRDYAARHVAMVKELGFEVAVTTSAGVAGRGTDPHQLPRFTPWDRNMTCWAARLTRNAWLGRPAQLC
jgi:peptidoglycan/xylan/chitin deacetylase (PgdA/CDA1 family)